MQKHKTKFIVGAVILAVLAFAFWYGGNAPGLRGWTPEPQQTEVTPTSTPMQTEMPENASTEEVILPEQTPIPTDIPQPEETPTGTPEAVQKMEIDPETGKDKYLTDPVPEGKPIPVEPQDAVISNQTLNCTLSVRCDTILNNMDWLDPEKVELVPQDGVIYAEKTVTFYEGESVFNVLLREMKQNKIHMEFENTPIYNSAYIEGIGNLYEFDCGELSGWMYRVNGWFPNYGCSRYQLKAGDRIEWVYTCDLGVDVGGHYAASGNRQ